MRWSCLTACAPTRPARQGPVSRPGRELLPAQRDAAPLRAGTLRSEALGMRTHWILIAAALGSGAAAAAATAQDEPGTILFQKELKTGVQLFTITPDGSGEKQITRVDGDAVHADWSDDGRRIVFE